MLRYLQEELNCKVMYVEFNENAIAIANQKGISFLRKIEKDRIIKSAD